MKTSRFKKVSPQDMWVMLLSTVRYSMGRRTYMSSLAGDLLFRYEKYLTTQQLIQVADEIWKELLLQASLGQTLGDDCDDKAWRETVSNLEKLIAMRGNKRLRSD